MNGSVAGRCFGARGRTTLAFQCAKELVHLSHSALDTPGRADLSRAAQSARLLHQLLPVPRGAMINACVSWQSAGRCGHITGR